VAGMELANYRCSLLQRLSNTAIADPLSRLCRRGTTKMADYLLPSLTEARTNGRPHQLLLLAVAAWMRYLRGTDLSGVAIEIVDRRRELITQAAALPLREGVALIVERLDAFAQLRGDPTFVDELLDTVNELDARGVRAVLQQLLQPRLAS
jgi:mannitol 2-dehydrogenase